MKNIFLSVHAHYLINSRYEKSESHKRDGDNDKRQNNILPFEMFTFFAITLFFLSYNTTQLLRKPDVLCMNVTGKKVNEKYVCCNLERSKMPKRN